MDLNCTEVRTSGQRYCSRYSKTLGLSRIIKMASCFEPSHKTSVTNSLQHPPSLPPRLLPCDVYEWSLHIKLVLQLKASATWLYKYKYIYIV